MQSPKAPQPRSEAQPEAQPPVVHRSIFREDSVRRYVDGQEKTVLPQMVSPRTFAYLWMLLGVLGASSVIAWFTRIPVYATGSAVVVRWRDKPAPDQSTVPNPIVVAAFLPPQSLSYLQTSKQVVLQLEGLGQNEGIRSILQVQPNILSPDAIQQQFALNPGVAQQIDQPAAVVILPLKPITSGLRDSAYLGSVGQVKAEVGTRRLLSFLPWIGHLIGQKIEN
jgi:hypothetical protein